MEISVAASVIGGLLVVGILYFVPRWIAPLVGSVAFTSLKINGTWLNEFVTPSGSEHRCTLELRQWWRRLSGTLTVTKKRKDKGEPEVKKFKVKGSIEDRFVILEMRNESKKQIGARVDLLEVVHGGGKMLGRGVWYSTSASEIQSQDFVWVQPGA